MTKCQLAKPKCQSHIFLSFRIEASYENPKSIFFILKLNWSQTATFIAELITVDNYNFINSLDYFKINNRVQK